MKRFHRRASAIAVSYFIYAGAAVMVLLLIAAVGSQASNGRSPMTAIFAIAVTSPIPMLLVGTLFFLGNQWSTVFAVALALVHVGALALQSHLASSGFVGELPWPQAELFYLFAAQTFYLPGSLVLAVIALVVRKSSARM